MVGVAFDSSTNSFTAVAVVVGKVKIRLWPTVVNGNVCTTVSPFNISILPFAMFWPLLICSCKTMQLMFWAILNCSQKELVAKFVNVTKVVF
jgi:hypothetical protein